VHFIMQRKQLLGIARRVELPMSHSFGFKTAEGKATYLAAYDAAMKAWPVPYEEMEIPTRFGMTHVVASGPKDAPPLVLLHGYMATLTMWAPNIADFNKDYRVFAVDVMGQPSKSIPDEPIRNAADYVAWLTATLNGMHLDRISLIGMSYGGWIALNYALGAAERVEKLALLSPAGSLLPLVRQFRLRGMPMVLFPTHFTVNSFMRWLGIEDKSACELTYLGLKHFRMSPETLRITPTAFSDGQLRAMHVPTLLLMGEDEVIYDPAAALERARRFVPNFRGELVPSSNHDMCFSQHAVVDARVLEFLSERRREISERRVA
jgi:pimeloyl-ACP methyl ester carboxylesterase